MKTLELGCLGLAAMFIPSIANSDVIKVAWPPDAAAQYYEGTLLSSGVRFRTQDTWILLGPSDHAVSVRPYYGNGNFGADLAPQSTATATTEKIDPPVSTVEDSVDAESEYDEYLDAALAEQRERAAQEAVTLEADTASGSGATSMTQTSTGPTSRTWHFRLASTLGNESIAADGGYSKFDGNAIVGGARTTITSRAHQSRWAFGLAADWRRFQFEQTEEQTAAPEEEDTTVQTDLSLLWVSPTATYDIWRQGPHRLSGIGGISYRTLPGLAIVDETRGETQLETSSAVLLRMAMMHIVDYGTWQVSTQLAAEPVHSGSGKVSAYDINLAYTQQFARDWQWFVEGTHTNVSATRTIDCPTVVNTLADCAAESTTADSVSLAALGFARRL